MIDSIIFYVGDIVVILVANMPANKRHRRIVLWVIFTSVTFFSVTLPLVYAQESVDLKTDSVRIIKLTEIQVEYDHVISEVPQLIQEYADSTLLKTLESEFNRNTTSFKDADPAEVVATIVAIAHQTKHVLEDPKPFVIFQGQHEQALVFDVYYWQVGEVFITRSELNIEIFKALKEQGIEISIPRFEIKNAI
jgi:hypothetical protein